MPRICQTQWAQNRRKFRTIGLVKDKGATTGIKQNKITDTQSVRTHFRQCLTKRLQRHCASLPVAHSGELKTRDRERGTVKNAESGNAKLNKKLIRI